MERNSFGQFVPGRSGNPSGMPRGTPKISVALMKILATRLGEDFKPVNHADRIALTLLKKAEIDQDIHAIKEILERTEGRVSVNVNVGSLERMSDEELENLVRRAGYDPERLADVLDVKMLDGE